MLYRGYILRLQKSKLPQVGVGQNWAPKSGSSCCSENPGSVVVTAFPIALTLAKF